MIIISESWYEFGHVEEKTLALMLIGLASVFIIYLSFTPRKVLKSK